MGTRSCQSQISLCGDPVSPRPVGRHTSTWLERDVCIQTVMPPGDKDTSLSTDTTFTHLSNCCPILQDVQVRQHINNIRAWVELRTVPQEAGRKSGENIYIPVIGICKLVKVLGGINMKSNKGINRERISDTTEGRLLFLSGLKASCLFFLPVTSSFHSSDKRDTEKQTHSDASCRNWIQYQCWMHVARSYSYN